MTFSIVARAGDAYGVACATGQSTFTGPGCMDWAGGVTGGDAESGYAIQGNILVGERVDTRVLQALREADA